MSLDIGNKPILVEKEVEVLLTKPQVASGNEIAVLLIELLGNEESVNELKASIKISDKSIEFTRLLVNKSPEIFISIANNINAVMVDGILDIADLPSIILLIKDVLNLNLDTIKSSVKNMTLQDSIQFIKDLLLILIEEDFIIVNNKKTVEKLIDACIELLSSTINFKTTFFSLASSALTLSCCKK